MTIETRWQMVYLPPQLSAHQLSELVNLLLSTYVGNFYFSWDAF